MTAPIAVFLVEWVAVGGTVKAILKRSALRYTGYLAGLAALAALVATGQTASHAVGKEEFGILDYFLFQPRVIWRYIRLGFLPFGLCFDYGPHNPSGARSVFDSSLWVKLLYAAALLIPAVSGFWLLIRQRISGLAVSLFFLILAPTSSILPLFMVAEEQRMYLPLALLLSLFIAGAYLFLKRAGLTDRRCAAIALIPAIALGFLTYGRNHDYRSDKAIWLATMETAPSNPHSFNSLGLIAWHQGNLFMAEKMFRQALALQPNYFTARNNLGLVLAMQGKYMNALRHYTYLLNTLDAASAKTSLAKVMLNIAFVYTKMGRRDDALKYSYKAIEVQPVIVEGHVNVGNLLLDSGEYKKAAEYFEKAVALDEKRISTYKVLIEALTKAGMVSDAKRYLAQAKRIFPKDPLIKDMEKILSRPSSA